MLDELRRKSNTRSSNAVTLGATDASDCPSRRSGTANTLQVDYIVKENRVCIGVQDFIMDTIPGKEEQMAIWLGGFVMRISLEECGFG